ncbi:MAG: hypothetical protein A3A94_00535 [Candidatus Portnoybacteria bacterium RIFCSPLOWO2_01_FULL_43_11]|uniref:Uncharacterized protein n=3 Tax=Candidatus Portnoyibacteriota TaxID=1817913 RepID=A0A1G2FB88_9BACT|nr:MAG: hypothetical protein A2815_02125 [Candidatus Portnoybacteria bacterium RIFCSPHIGHO2_01_FULL_40_12b]OGZ36977.1 MAG: hypothetical protein A3D38_00655 [Candidatus Portnoybacteria bacterium RIFCSPHIGHO2_02_FULL_40_23]OGZ38334.1 MAG: hypothetical protein A3A94_00535 [Candidatus Portnoybacteria bacterium RIFCSPLOWO2_01_FULL_43_11]OGZ41188.1 MAG: hypothetical protein A3I20_02580 [Candidatus Portnoybacteria bacterium RIFCSPLOWO2_02_FULL_40_15]
MKPLKEELEKIKRETQEKIFTLILAGFGLVAALAWNDAIQSLFNFLFPKTNGIIGKFAYAIIITIIVVLITLQLKKISKK